jgi:hypothetical protein
MNTVAVSAGDHDAEPSNVYRLIHPSRAAELFAIRNSQWSLEELRALSDRFADAVQALQVARTNEDFAALREAILSLHEICHQAAGLNLGLKNSISRALR